MIAAGTSSLWTVNLILLLLIFITIYHFYNVIETLNPLVTVAGLVLHSSSFVCRVVE